MKFIVACIIIYIIYSLVKKNNEESNGNSQVDPTVLQDNFTPTSIGNGDDYEMKVCIYIPNPPVRNEALLSNSTVDKTLANNKPTTPYYQKLGKANVTPNLFDKKGKKWHKNGKRSKKGGYSSEYSYNISDQTDKDLFNKQCIDIEKYFPGLKKEALQKLDDGSLLQRYHHEKGDIVVYNNEFVGALYMTSGFDIDEYFEEEY